MGCRFGGIPMGFFIDGFFIKPQKIFCGLMKNSIKERDRAT